MTKKVKKYERIDIILPVCFDDSMKKSICAFVAGISMVVTLSISLFSVISRAEEKSTDKSSQAKSAADAKLAEIIINEPHHILQNTNQLTFVGERSGEGYFSADGKKMIFQSERELGNPFYQMFILDLKSGKTTRVSTGQGKTTCGWIHPNLKKVMWSSTHLDPKLKQKVASEYADRAKPVKGRYAWSFDDQFDIFESDLNGKHIKQLTHAKGYDAEGSYSPDGKWIVFASNRSAFEEKLSAEDQKMFDQDASYAMEIYIMKADGSGVKRLTYSPGYDGGPFFSADGRKITWRRFSADGRKAEIYTMNTDGSEQKQITHLGSMSWAPFYHPTGDYIIFSSSLLGYSNFELFIVDSLGTKKPVRITFADGFDGLASFSPDGKQMTWSHKNEKGESQIYIAGWDDSEARRLLGLPEPAMDLKLTQKRSHENLHHIIKYLASEQMQGRKTGSSEEKIYTQKWADLFKSWGLKPVIGNSFIQKFEFISGVQATEKNSLEINGRITKKLVPFEDFQVLSYSKTGIFPAKPVVFVGYGLKAPATDKIAGYDSYKDLDVAGKWVLMFEGIPDLDSKDIQHQLITLSGPQHKITVAKNAGAAGVLFISNISSKTLKFEGSLSDSTIPVLKLAEARFMELIKNSDHTNSNLSFEKLKQQFDTVTPPLGFQFDSQYLAAEVDLKYEKSVGLNVIGQLIPKVLTGTKALIIGAHGDHLGRGEIAGSSLARADEKGKVHYGADDNASGVSGVLELAQYFSQPENLKNLKKPLSFAIWSGEETGVLGSHSFVKVWEQQQKKPFKSSFEASLNMDMIGRLRETLQVQGVGSAKEWSGLSEEVGLLTGQSLVLTSDPYLPTDAMTFYLAEIPSISFFTGAHAEYHSPRDTADTINFLGLEKVITVVQTYIEKIAQVKGQLVNYKKVEGNSGQRLEGRSFRIYLGTIPDYSQDGVKGVRVSGASKNSPAEKAGIQINDIIIEFDKTKIENLYDYVYTLQSVKANKPTKIKVSRESKILELDITPILKE